MFVEQSFLPIGIPAAILYPFAHKKRFTGQGVYGVLFPLGVNGLPFITYFFLQLRAYLFISIYPKNCIVKGTIFYNNTINDYLIVQDLDIAHIIEAKVVELTDIQGYQAKMSSTVHLSKVETIGFSPNAVKDLKNQFDIKARELASYLHIEYRGGQSSSMMCIGV